MHSPSDFLVNYIILEILGKSNRKFVRQIYNAREQKNSRRYLNRLVEKQGGEAIGDDTGRL